MASRPGAPALLLALAGACGGAPAAPPQELVEVPADGFVARLEPPARITCAGGGVLARGLAEPARRAAVEGGVPERWEVSPPLPAGLALDPDTGVWGGTPAALAPMTTHVVTARNAAGAASCPLRLAVLEPGAVWLAPPGVLLTRGELRFEVAVAGGGEVRLEVSAGELAADGGYVAPWYPGPVEVRAVAVGAGEAAAETFEVMPRTTSNVSVRLLEPAGDTVAADTLHVSARVDSRYLLVSVEATLDGAALPLEPGEDGGWGATVPLGPASAGPHLLRVAGIDFAGAETEVFRAFTVVR